MPAVALEQGTALEMDGEVFHYLGTGNDHQIHLQSTKDRKIATTTHEELFDKICKGKAVIELPIRAKEDRRKRLRGRLKQEIMSLNDKTRAVFEKRYAYIKGVVAHMPIPITHERIQPVITEVASRIGDDSPPSASSVCRWWKDYVAGSRDPRALIPSFKKRGNRKRRLQQEVLEIVSKAIEDQFLNIQQGSPADVMAAVTAAIKKRNGDDFHSDQMEIPDRRTVYREIGKVDAYVKTAKRYGKEAAERLFKIVQKAPKATRPLERVEIDHTVLNYFVVDEETGMVIGRPTITIAVDCYTRWIVGFYIGFEPPGWEAVMHCLRNAMLPNKTWLQRFPSIKNEWECCGVPESIVVDNGREFHSHDFELACEQLGIQIIYTPRAKPWFKGTVERVFHTIDTNFLTGGRGRTLGRFVKESEYDPQKDAVIGLTQLTEAFCKWVVDVYSQSYHSGLGRTPAQAWRQGIIDHPSIRYPTDLHDFTIILSSSSTRTIQRYGIEINSLKYQSDELGMLRRHLYRKGNPSVDVKYDPSNLGHIYVKDPQSGEYLTVPAVDLEYADKTNLWQHKVVTRWQRRQKAENDKVYRAVQK